MQNRAGYPLSGGVLSNQHPGVGALAYPLRAGFVANWLVAGPQASPDSLTWDDDPGIEGVPVERGPLDIGTYQVGEHTGAWAYYACPDDRYVDHSGGYPPDHRLRSWAYAELVVDAATTVTVELSAPGLAGLWLDGALVLRSEHGSTCARVRLN
jgi:hypothetical protein